MGPGLPPALLWTLAALGGLAVVLRLGGALLRLGMSAAESTAATGLAELSERRGDVTGFLERRRAAHGLRRRRARAGLAALAWLALLSAPPLLGVAREAFAACSLLWLLPRPRARLPVRRG